MRDSTVLPNLHMLPAEALVPHEDCDPRRVERLSRRIEEERCLKNPPIVARIPDSDQYVVLDGANRSQAFALLGIAHIVAQVVSYDDPGIALDTWYHVVSGLAVEEFEAAVTGIAGVELLACKLETARAALQAQRAAAYIVVENNVRVVSCPHGCQPTDMLILNELVNTYKGRADIFRASNDVWGKQAPYYPEITALVIFPRLNPVDIVRAAQNGYRIPSGITRHIIPNRAVNINIPLRVLRADWSLERKRAWLQEWLMERMAANAIRYYAESTFSYNE